MDTFYFLDPLSVAANGFDLFDQYSDALSVASLGFIKLKVTSIVVTKRSGGGDQGLAGVLPPVKIWKDLENVTEVPNLEKVKEIFSTLNAEQVEITLEPINGALITIEQLEPLQREFEKIFTTFKVNLEYQEQPIEKKPEFLLILEKIEDVK